MILALALAHVALSPGTAPSGPELARQGDASGAPRRRVGLGELDYFEPTEAGLVMLASVTDGGVRAADSAPLHPVRRGRAAYDPCVEPLPAHVAPPEGLELVAAGRIQVAFHRSWLDVDDALALARSADDALVEAAALVDFPPREHLLVLVHESHEAMAEATGVPPWTAAAYDGAVHVVAHQHAGSLRHEVLHAELHAAAPCAPYWLDEGLATYFQGQPLRRALSWLRMIHAHMWIPFDSLAALLGTDEGAEEMEMAEVALLYAQSLAMVMMLADEGGPDAIARAVVRSRSGVQRHDAWPLAMPGVGGEDLVRYLAGLLFPNLPPSERETLRGRAYRCARGDGELPVCEVWDRRWRPR